jgi:asparagine synthase (glutamine-hydrolysing)
MPGIHFVHSSQKRPDRLRIESALKPLLFDDRYRQDLLFSDQQVVLYSTKYGSYPVRSFKTEKFEIFFEGYIYGQTDSSLLSQLEELALIIFGVSADPAISISRWIRNQDGEFIIMIRENESGRWVFINDILARLPVYRMNQNGIFYLSRDISFFKGLGEVLAPDKQAINQLIVTGSIFNSRTFFEPVKSVPPATLLLWDNSSSYPKEIALTGIVLKEEKKRIRRKDLAAELADLFVTACRTRAIVGPKVIVSLSGGLDSRSVVCGLLLAPSDFSAITYKNDANPDDIESCIAGNLARILGFKWEQLQLPAVTGNAVSKFFDFKCGLLDPDNARDLFFFSYIRQHYGSDLVFFSGDGGDKTLPRLYPRFGFDSISALAHNLSKKFSFIPEEIACKLVAHPDQNPKDELRQLLSSYPEISPQEKYMKFIIAERCARILFEGEDRNRHSIWATTPFYSLPFFQKAITCPSSLKNGHKLYREFLNCLSPQAASLPDAKRGMPLTSARYGLYLEMIEFINAFPRLTGILKKRLIHQRTYSPDVPILQCLRKQIERNQIIGDILDVRYLRTILDSPGMISRTAFNTLLNIMTFLEILERGKRSLDEYSEINLLS